MDKGKGIVSLKVGGCDVGCVDGFNTCVSVSPPCMALELFPGGVFAIELLPLAQPPPPPPPDSKRDISWCSVKIFGLVLKKVKEIRHQVGLSCEGFEEVLMALLTAIEASHFQKESASSSKWLTKETENLKDYLVR